MCTKTLYPQVQEDAITKELTTPRHLYKNRELILFSKYPINVRHCMTKT